MEAQLDRFRKADTQVLGVSVDSVHSHANWARSLGGVSFPLLADFHPKGAVARSFGHYLEDAGITDRATVIIDKQGTVRYSHSVTPAGARDIAELAAEAERINAGSPAHAAATASPPRDAKLFVKSDCGHSLRALIARDNLRLAGGLPVANVSEDADAADELLRAGGKNQAPCLLIDGEALYEAPAIVSLLADRCAPLLA